MSHTPVHNESATPAFFDAVKKHPLSIFLRGNLQKRSKVLLRPDVENLMFYENSKVFELCFPQEAIDQSDADDYATYTTKFAGALIKNLAESTIISFPAKHAYADFLTFSNENENSHFIAG